jgi:hypothetical protein
LTELSVNWLADDIEKVTGEKPNVGLSLKSMKGQVVIIGTLGNNEIINDLAKKHKEFNQIKGHWERFIIKTILNPYPGIEKALVIAGSDKRGTAYGVLSLSEEIGVSPWYWWADVQVSKKNEIILYKDNYISKSPSVKYRGIFINDEAPALSNWA